jgi:acetyl-CoA hydrolase
VPWTYSDKVLHQEDFSLMVETSRPPAFPSSRAPGAVETAIARHAASFVPDGAVLEFGIGALPDAVCSFLDGRKNLSIHSGAVGDGIMELLQKGIATRADAAMLIGTRKLFDFARENEAIRLRSSEYTVGAVGGAPDFIRAANQSPGGVSLMLLPSARIVARLSGPVATSRSQAGIIVTERGAADLRGCSLRERERRLCAIS